MKNTVMYGLVIIVLISTVIVVNSSGLQQQYAAATNKGVYDAIFERNGEICYFNSTDDTITIIANGGKYYPALSPDNTRILYLRSALETEGNVLQFGIVNLKGEQLLDIIIDTEFSNAILNCGWLSESSVCVTTHVNPSTSEFFIYDSNTGDMTERLVGYSFTPIPDSEDVIYAKNVPHWSDESVYHSYIVNGKIVYTSNILNAKLSQPIFSKDSSKIAFVEDLSGLDLFAPDKGYEDGLDQRIIVADFNVNTKTINNIERIDVPIEITGNIYFDDNNNIRISKHNFLQAFNDTNETFDISIFNTNSHDRVNDLKLFADLLESVNKQWGDTSLDEINSIIWAKAL